MVPGVAAAAARVSTDDDRLTTAGDEAGATDQGVPVGDADVRADMERSGAETDDDDTLADPGEGALPDAGSGTATDQGTPVGEADLDADRRRTGADDDGV
jgi:hypothetical protein